jgi:hypothetical protein
VAAEAEHGGVELLDAAGHLEVHDLPEVRDTAAKERDLGVALPDALLVAEGLALAVI